MAGKSKIPTTVHDVDAADIAADLTRQKRRLSFAMSLCVLAAASFVLHTCMTSPGDPDPSVECARIPGSKWIPPNDDPFKRAVPGYCSR